MKSLVFIVEGETEWEFINRLLTPYLTEQGVNTVISAIMITMSGGGHGFNSIEHFKNTIEPVLFRKDEPFITTMIDHYGINSERKLPGYEECIKGKDMEGRIAKMEEKINEVVQKIKPYRFFIPHLQRHEFETLLFAKPNEGFYLYDKKIKEEIIELCKSFPSIEDINHTPQGAPSKRLEKIFTKYNDRYEKVTEAVDIAELTSIPSMMEQCPHFKNWIETIIKTLWEH